MHAEGFPAGELKHGPIALIEQGLPVVVVMPSPTGRSVLHHKMLSNLAEVRARGARTIVIGEARDDAARKLAADYIDGAARADAADAVRHDRADAGAGRDDRAGAWLRHRQAAQPREVRHRRVVRRRRGCRARVAL